MQGSGKMYFLSPTKIMIMIVLTHSYCGAPAMAFTPPCLPFATRASSSTVRRSAAISMSLNDREPGVPSRRALLRNAAALVPILLTGNPATAAQENDLVLVLGATGLIGQYVSTELKARGYRVRGVTRRAEEAKKTLGGGIEWVSADLMDPSSLAAVMPGVSKIIFVAGAKGKGAEKNRKVYAEAVGELASLGAAQGVSKFILLSSGGVTIDGASWPDYIRDVLFWKKRGENLLRASGTPYSIVRAYSYSGEEEEPLKHIVTRGKHGTSTGDLQLYQGDRPDVGGLISRHDLAVVAVEAMEFAPAGNGQTSQGTTFEVIDREMQYYHCDDGTCVGRVQARKDKKGALVAETKTPTSSQTVSDFGPSSSSSFCSASEDDCEWRQTLRRLPLDVPK